MRVTRCRVCEGQTLQPFLDLGMTALANRFLRPEQRDEPEPRFPLRVVLCADCGLVQIDEEVPRELLFADYIYVSGTSDLLHRHARWLAEGLTRRYRLGANDLVMEAASNDGSVLKAFQTQRVRVLGVEPAANIAARAEAAGIRTVIDFFDDRLAQTLRAEHGAARLFLARHVLAHVTDLHGFVRGIQRVLAPDGVAVIEAPHLVPLYRRLEFDTIYHEHLCYFSATVLQTLFRRFDLQVIDVDRLTIHGGSVLVHVAHARGPHAPSPRVSAVLTEEASLGLTRLETWRSFAGRVTSLRSDLLTFLDDLNRQGRRLAGYGAPAKGNTLLAYCDIGPDQLPFLVDKSPHKQGLLTPGHHIPVFGPAKLLEERPDVTLMLAWNFAAEIVEQQTAYLRGGGRFAVPIPAPRLFGAAA